MGDGTPAAQRPGASSDRQRLARLVPGSRADFDLLYRLTYDTIVRTCLIVLGGDPAAAQDCAQDTFVRAYRAWPRWRPEAPVEVWLHRIAVNVARSYRRRRMLRELPLVLDGLRARPRPLDDTFAVMRALGQIPTVEATALLLRYFHGYSGEEIAAGLGLPASTVRGRIVRARNRLKQLLGDVSEDAPGSAIRALSEFEEKMG